MRSKGTFHVLQATAWRWMSTLNNNNERKTILKTSRVTYRRIGVFSVLVTCVTCGCLLWIEIEAIKGKLSSTGKLRVFDFDKSTNPYIYIREKEIDLRNKSQDIKNRYLNPEKIKQESWFPWIQSHSQDPWTLLKLTRSSDRKTRWLGVKAIAEMEDWEDYQCRYIAQSCDARTLVGLARTPNTGSRFFLPPRNLEPLKGSCTSELRRLLMSLPVDGMDRCADYFTSIALEKGQAVGEKPVWWGTGVPSVDTPPRSPQPLPDSLVQLYYLEALEAHTQDSARCNCLVEDGLLHVLRHLVEKESDPHLLRLGARILGNLSRCPALHNEIIRLGWVPILAGWMTHEDLELSQHASRCLMNLDRDDLDMTFDPGVYVLHPTYRQSEPLYCDIVFVHGIMGGPFKTWRQRDSRYKADNDQSMCWPMDWLAVDCPHSRILCVEFDTHVSEWYVRCPYNQESRTIESQGRSLLEQLHKAGVGSRPVVWVGHSMGGLLIKQLLAMSEGEERYRDVAAQTEGVVFYSVPHHGSPLADTSHQAWYLIYPSVEVQQLRKDSPKLEALNSRFTQFMQNNSVPCLSFGETVKTSLGKNLPKVLIVPPQSSNAGIGEFHQVEADHINICKPENKDSDLYSFPLGLVNQVVLQSKLKKLLKAGIEFGEMSN